MSLAVTRVGEEPISYVFLHGLLGQGKNWSTIAKALLPSGSLLVDLPDHGRSPWSEDVSYESMAEAVIDLLPAACRSRSHSQSRRSSASISPDASR